MLKMNFESGRGTIDVTMDCNGNGEAYFRRDDMFAPITLGTFTHPMFNTAYRILSGYGTKSRRYTLQTQTWETVSDTLPYNTEEK